MKFFLLLAILGIFALTVRASTIPEARDGVVEKIQEFIEHVVADVKSSVQNALSKFLDVGKKIKDQIADLVKKSHEKLTNIKTTFESKIYGLVKDGLAKKACVDKYLPELDEGLRKSKMDITGCTEDSLRFAVELGEIILANTVHIADRVLEIRNLYDACVHILKPVSTVKCVYDKAGEIKQGINDIIDGIRYSVSESFDYVTNSGKCIATSVKDAKKRGDDLIQKIKICSAAF